MENNSNTQPDPVPAQPQPTEPQPVQPLQPTAESGMPTTASPKKGLPKVAKIIIGVVGGLIVLIAIGIFALFAIVNNGTKPAVEVSDAFVNAVQANDASAAYALTSSAFKASTTEARLTTVINTVSSALTGDEVITGKSLKSTNGVNQAAIAYSVENSGKTRYIRVVSQETDGTWQVINFKSSDTVLEAIVE